MNWNDGRCITIARVRAGMTSVELARRLHYSPTFIRLWESGKREPKWDQLYAILPDLPEIRTAGCAAYCPKADTCKKDGNCAIAFSAKTMRRSRDLVEVVRCADCSRGAEAEVHGRRVVRCPYMERCMAVDAYCSEGKRRMNDD